MKNRITNEKIGKDEKTKMTEVEKKVVQSAASFLGSQMEV